MKTMPATTMAAVIGVKSKRPKGVRPAARRASVTRMLGGVEMPVNGPPRRQPRARGMSSREGGRPLRRASSMVAGSRMAATVTVLMRADSRLAAIIRATISSASPPLAKRCSGSPERWAMPVRVSPAERMNMAHTVTTAGLLKPASASWAVTRPVNARADSTSSPTRSTRSQPPMKRTNAAATMVSRIMTSNGKMVSSRDHQI